MPTIAAGDPRTSIGRAFIALGACEVDATIVADHLVDAELRGVTSHGAIRVAQ